MFQEILGGLMNKEQAVYDAIQETMLDISQELKCSPSEFIIAIKATDEKFNFKLHIMRATPEGNVWVREITIKEVIGE